MSMIIGGVEPFTTVDFPGRLAAVLFCQGCTWRCPYCHNPDLQPFSEKTGVSWERVLEFLDSRQKLLDGIVFSGGEPLWQKDLQDAMQQVKDMGFEVGLHTSGAIKSRLVDVLPLIDWIGFDVKVPFDAYETRIPHSNGKEVYESLKSVLEAGIDVEVRTTLDPRLISTHELRTLAYKLADMGVSSFALQEYRPHSTHDEPPPVHEITSFFNDHALLQELNDLFFTFNVRRA